jgi:hypothetical protein
VDAEALNAQRLLIEFAESQLPHSTGVLIFGSCATGRAHASSDIDACLTMARIDRPFQQSYEFRGRTLDVHFYDQHTLLQAMQKQRRNRVAHIAVWLRTGVILKDEGGALLRAKSLANEIFDSPMEPVDWANYRASISNLARHIRISNDEWVRASCLNALYRITTNFILLREGRWLQSPTELPRELRDLDAELCARLHHSYRAAILGDSTSFLAVVECELGKLDESQRHLERRSVG